MFRLFLILALFLVLCHFGHSQDQVDTAIDKNQILINIPYLTVGSPNLSFERYLGRHFAIGLSGVSYGNAHKDLDLETQGYEYTTNWEINPFSRWYINGNQGRSHFLEFFASINEGQEDNRVVRVTNDLGYGVYVYGIEKTNNFGLGAGYGYRFILANDKLVLEAQIALRTNFEFEYFFYDAGIVRTGVRIGYRF